MGAVGIREMLVGIGILSPRSKMSSYAASAWLLSIALNLWLNDLILRRSIWADIGLHG